MRATGIIRQRFQETPLRKAFDRNQPRWPKGTPGIGGQFRPKGLPDAEAGYAARVLSELDESNPRHRQLAKSFNQAAKREDWRVSPRSNKNTVRRLLERTVLDPLDNDDLQGGGSRRGAGRRGEYGDQRQTGFADPTRKAIEGRRSTKKGRALEAEARRGR